MVHKKSSTNDIVLRVATAMQQMGIDGLPRNYELVYEAYAGANPDLVREFIALGKYKTQAALDELGRKYLPHHHEESVLQRSAGAVRDEMTNFMELLKEEKSSLNDYGRIIGEASQAIESEGSLGTSIEVLKAATERQASLNAAMQASVQARAEAVDGIRNDLIDFEARKFTDPATGLANRRAFNKAVAKVYADPEKPVACGLVVADVEVTKRFSARQTEALRDYLVTHYSALVRQSLPPDAVAAKLAEIQAAVWPEFEIERLKQVRRQRRPPCTAVRLLAGPGDGVNRFGSEVFAAPPNRCRRPDNCPGDCPKQTTGRTYTKED